MTPDVRAQNDVYGFVTNQVTGEPLVDADVGLLTGISTPENLTQVSTNASGQFLFCSVADGSYVISVKKPGFYMANLAPITISGGTIVRSDIALQPISLPQATVNGFIKQQNGIPIANACVGLYLLNPQGIEILQQVTFTDSNGFYIFGRAIAGNYIVKAKSEKVV